MKKVFTYLFLFLFSMQSFEVVWIVFSFELNRDFFAEICMNKDKPKMKCNGKCHLKKQLEQHEKEQSEKEQMLLKKEIQAFIHQFTDKHCIAPTIQTVQILVHKSPLHSSGFLERIFHPPQQICTA